jgi:hypothetical protein
MAKAKETEKVEVATEEVETKTKKGKFKVFDSNGKQVREVETEEEAKTLAKIFGGKVK